MKNNNMRVAIIGMANLSFMPYLFFYTNYLNRSNIAHEVIYWNRLEIEEEYDFRSYSYSQKVSGSRPIIIKVLDSLKFRNYVVDRLLKNDYDFVIVLSSTLAVLLNDFLITRYYQKYLVDIRDYTYESNWIYYRLLKRVMAGSKLNVISSPGFKEFLPCERMTLCHNLSINTKFDRTIRRKYERIKNPIRVNYVGAISYFDHCKKFINSIANDSRIIFGIYGEGIHSPLLKKYCEDNQIYNVKFHGLYNPCDKESIYENTDVLFNAYGNDNTVVKYALSNKFYDAVWYGIPLLVNMNTAMASFSKSLSLVVDYSESQVTQILNWYQSIDWYQFEADAAQIIEIAENDNMQCIREMDEIFG